MDTQTFLNLKSQSPNEFAIRDSNHKIAFVVRSRDLEYLGLGTIGPPCINTSFQQAGSPEAKRRKKTKKPVVQLLNSSA